MNDATGGLNAQSFLKQQKAGAPLTGQAQTIANFANAFPMLSRAGENVAQGVTSHMIPVEMAAGAAAGHAFGGIPGAIAGGLAPLTRGGARSLALSHALQSMPQYTSGLLPKTLSYINPQNTGLALRGYGQTQLSSQ